MATTLTEILGNAGAALEFEHDGKIYRASKLTQKIKAACEQYLNAHAIEAAEFGLRPTRRRQYDADNLVADLKKRRDQTPSENGRFAELTTELVDAERELVDAELMLGEARESMKKTKDDIAIGEYRFGGKLWIKSLSTPTGVLKFAALLLGITEDETLNLFAEASEKVEAIIDAAIRQSLPKALMERPAA